MRLVIVALVLVVVAGSAHGERRCADLPTAWDKLEPHQKERLPNSEFWRQQPTALWKSTSISVWIDRAPHIAREILAACPGVMVDSEAPNDTRRLKSFVRIRVTTYAALVRLAQLPAITKIEPQRRFRHDIDFEDPL